MIADDGGAGMSDMRWKWPDGQDRDEQPYRCGAFRIDNGNDQCQKLSDHDGPHTFASGRAPPSDEKIKAEDAAWDAVAEKHKDKLGIISQLVLENSELRSRLTSLEHKLREALKRADRWEEIAKDLDAVCIAQAARLSPDDAVQVMSFAGIVSVVRAHREEVESP